MLRVFDSVGEFVAAVPAPGTKVPEGIVCRCENDGTGGNVVPRRNAYWTGGLTFHEAMDKAKLGDSSLVPSAERMLENLEFSLPSTSGWETLRSPFGGRVNIGDWLAGSPTPMRRRVKRVNDISPIKVIVSLSSSAGIGQETMAARGTAILAFLMQAQRIRPIELYGLIEVDGSKDGSVYFMIKVESKPLNLSQAAFVLANVGFARHGYNLADMEGFQGAWPEDYYSGEAHYAPLRRQRLHLEPNDVVIPAAFLSDPLIAEPVQWITNELAKISQQTNVGE